MCRGWASGCKSQCQWWSRALLMGQLQIIIIRMIKQLKRHIFHNCYWYGKTLNHTWYYIKASRKRGRCRWGRWQHQSGPLPPQYSIPHLPSAAPAAFHPLLPHGCLWHTQWPPHAPPLECWSCNALPLEQCDTAAASVRNNNVLNELPLNYMGEKLGWEDDLFIALNFGKTNMDQSLYTKFCLLCNIIFFQMTKWKCTCVSSASGSLISCYNMWLFCLRVCWSQSTEIQ